jgi:hypothetical protein
MLLREAIAARPHYPEALEQLGTLLVTRKHRFDDGLAALAQASEQRPEDAGLWYTLGWCREFAAHEMNRRGAIGDTRAMYERAAEAFRRCLALKPDGKLVGDAEDLLDHIENELRALE